MRKPRIIAQCSSLLYNPCIQCHEKNTIKCTPTSNSSSVCHCYQEFSEASKCFEKKNPCEVIPLGASQSGNTACRTEFGNLCIPQLGTHKYTCICITPFRASRDLNFSNCMGDQETPCDRQLCVGFQPLTPRDTTVTPRSVIITGDANSAYEEGAKCVENGTCICPNNWHGENCINWHASPLEVSWTSYSACKPECLDRSLLSPLSDATGIGYKVSKSFCDAEDQRYCGGTLKKWSRCKVATLCPREDEKETEKFESEVAEVSAEIMKQFYNKDIAAQMESPELLIWSEKWNLFFIYFLITVFGFTLTVTLMEIGGAVRLTRAQINEIIAKEGSDMEGRRFNFRRAVIRRKANEIEV
nr:hypothetical protein HmN_000186800 [Hymenolepis microstoma]